MKIGIIGSGNIGGTLASKLSAAGHDVKIANSRGPETIDKSLLTHGARAVTSKEAVQDVDVVITSTPPLAFPKALAPLLKPLPDKVTIIDTSNYYPFRDGKIDAIENGQVESVWVSEQLGGRPIAKAYNNIYYRSLQDLGKPKGTPGRIALPVSADRHEDYEVTAKLNDELGFDSVRDGEIKDSWRQQPGTPVYCTDLDKKGVEEALQKANRETAPKNRDETIKIMMGYVKEHGSMMSSEQAVAMSRKVNNQ